MGCNVSKDVKVEDRHGGGEKGGEGSEPMSEERAAEKIQASFRGYKTRKTLKDNGTTPKQPNATQNDVAEENSSKKEDPSADANEIVDLDLTDVELEKAAVKIQASYRNFAKKKEEQQQPQPQKQEEQEKVVEEEEEVDIDLEDPDVATAALKIQSTFRGYKARKEVRQ